MASIKQYKTAKGEKKYKFQLYAGLDPQTGKPKHLTRSGFKTKRDANAAISKLQLEIESGGIKRENNILFKDVYAEWFKSYITTVRQSTYSSTMAMFNNHILKAFGAKRIRTIRIGDVQTAVNQWHQKAPASFNRWFYYTSMVFKHAIKEQYIDKNPCEYVSIPKTKHKQRKAANFWDKEQLNLFFSCLDPVNELEKYVLFRLLAYAGLRRGELLALTWDDIKVNSNTINVNKTLTQGVKSAIVQAPKTIKGRRQIAMDKTTMQYLKRWHLLQRKAQLKAGTISNNKASLVFSTQYSANVHRSLNTPAKWLNKLIKDNHLKPITIHGFRHSHASALFAAGASIKEVQERLGHEQASTTMDIYTHVSKQQNTDAVNKLTKYLNN